MTYLKRSITKLIFLLISAFLITNYQLPITNSATPDELKRAIEERSKELSEITNQIYETQRNLTATEQKGKTLNQEIKRIDYQVNQVNLSIKSSQIKIEKLGLEMQSLGYEISDRESEIEAKKEAIADFLRELHEKNQESILLIFLKNKSLAESLFETQSISSLSEGLTLEVEKLHAIKAILADRHNEASEKKVAVEAENRNLKNRKTIAEEQKNERQELLRSSKNQERLYQQQLKELEKIQAEIAAEIEEAERELRARIDPNLLPVPRPGVLSWPAANGRLTQGYGGTAFALRNYRGKHHNGVDIAAPIGTEIYAGEAGEVVTTGNQDRYCPRAAYGKFIVIKHDNGLTTLYAHLSQTIVSVGQKVGRDQLIGYMGKSGWATGSHLHFTVWSTNTYVVRLTRSCGPMPVGGDIDPMQYLESAPIS